jgi:hypothetical protein
MSLTISTPTVGNPVGQRRLMDANYVSTVAVTGGATLNSSSFDLINSSSLASGNEALERVDLAVSLSGTIVSTGTLAATWQHSADNSTWATVPELGVVTFSAANGNITPVNGANGDVWGFPSTINRYVRCQLAASSAGITAGNATVALYF